jgi:hypothetical protein
MVDLHARVNGLKRLPAVFYRREPVREWLQDLDSADRKIVGDDIRDCEFAWPVGLPLCAAARIHQEDPANA